LNQHEGTDGDGLGHDTNVNENIKGNRSERYEKTTCRRSLYGKSISEVKTPTGVLFQHVEDLGIGNICDGAVLVTQGGTTVHAVCVVKKKGAEDNAESGFLPLTVDYRERSHGMY
jgi:hypothetical protein